MCNWLGRSLLRPRNITTRVCVCVYLREKYRRLQKLIYISILYIYIFILILYFNIYLSLLIFYEYTG